MAVINNLIGGSKKTVIGYDVRSIDNGDGTQTLQIDEGAMYPIEISTANEMNALLVADNVGKVYKFTGTTDSNYTNGDLYIVEETS